VSVVSRGCVPRQAPPRLVLEQVKTDDFRGLRTIAEATRKAFVLGILLYLGSEVVPFGRRPFAMPVTSLWAVREV